MSDKKFILLINSLTQGGAERVCLRISEKLKSENFEHKIISVSNSQFYDNECNVQRLASKDKISHFSKVFFLFRQFIFRNDAVVVFSLDLAFYLNIMKILGFFKGRIICRFINNPNNEVGSGVFGKVKKKLLYNIIGFSDCVICQSDAMLSLLRNIIPDSNLVRIYNPISNNPNPNPIPNRDERECNKMHLLYVGRLVEQKNLFDILKIARQLINNKVQFIWNIVGGGDLYPKFEEEIKTQGLEGYINLHGSCSNVNDFYYNSDVTTLVSHYEGLPNVLLESMSCGTPCISYDLPTGPSEIIVENVNGCLVRQYDIYEFCDKLIHLYNLNLKSDSLYHTIPAFHDSYIVSRYIDLMRD